MTLQDFIDETKQRYRTLPTTTATRRTAKAFRYGVARRIGHYIGEPIWKRDDWDVLIALDTCRTDLWREVAPEYDALPNDASPVWSNASCSIDWINRNFNGYPNEVKRTGYVTANPFADHDSESAKSADLTDTDLAYFDPLYKTHWTDVTPEDTATSLHEETGRAKVGSGIATVPPEAVTDHAIEAWRNRDALGFDRLVVHYMQPHEPYRARPGWGSGDSNLLENLVDEEADAGASIWPQLQDGNISLAEFWKVYKDNLRWVLDDLSERLVTNMDAEIVFTADHGNALGELGEWHHPPGAIGPSVRRVPWVSVEGTDSHTVKPGVSVAETTSQNPGEVDTDAQLKALGYK
jgi:hypothetical protein